MGRESAAHWIFASAAMFCAGLTLVIFIFMAMLGLPVLARGNLLQTLLGPWSPEIHGYGIGPMIIGTFCIAGLALVLSIPLSLGCTIFIQVTAPKKAASILQKLIQLMTGIPTVIYGFVGIFFLVPMVREIPAHGSGLCILTAGIMLALLITPTMTLFFIHGLRQVPESYALAVAALGGTPIQGLIYVMLPCAWRSVLAGIVLGFGRAVGDTMIALMLAGNAVALPQSVLDSTRTLTAHIAMVIAADFDSLEFRTLFICGLILYAVTTLAAVVVRAIIENRMERA